MDEKIAEKITQVARLIVQSGSVVVFTGAGVSTESGIPDFRSPGGIWTSFDPEDFTIEKFLTSLEARRKHWQLLLGGGLLKEVLPNAAHRAIRELERIGKLSCVITQNIDNLHQQAGSTPELVFELHGNMKWIKCLTCSDRNPLEDILSRRKSPEDVPSCERCGGILKPEVVFFGEALPEKTLREATRHAKQCDLFLVIGSSLVVYPAAYLPMYAKESGGKLVIINKSETPYDSLADVVIDGGAGEVMSHILAEVLNLSHH